MATRNQRGLSKRSTWLLLAAIGLAFGAYATEPAWRPLLSKPMASGAATELGAQLYAQHCAACHGPNAEGQDPAQRMGGQRADGTYVAPALNGRGHMWHHAPAQIRGIVKDGSPASDSPMRGFADRLSDEEIDAVVAYLQSLWPGQLRERYRGMHGMGGMGGRQRN